MAHAIYLYLVQKIFFMCVFKLQFWNLNIFLFVNINYYAETFPVIICCMFKLRRLFPENLIFYFGAISIITHNYMHYFSQNQSSQLEEGGLLRLRRWSDIFCRLDPLDRKITLFLRISCIRAFENHSLGICLAGRSVSVRFTWLKHTTAKFRINAPSSTYKALMHIKEKKENVSIVLSNSLSKDRTTFIEIEFRWTKVDRITPYNSNWHAEHVVALIFWVVSNVKKIFNKRSLIGGKIDTDNRENIFLRGC